VGGGRVTVAGVVCYRPGDSPACSTRCWLVGVASLVIT
jgi:hypothetical protein